MITKIYRGDCSKQDRTETNEKRCERGIMEDQKASNDNNQAVNFLVGKECRKFLVFIEVLSEVVF